MSFALFFFTWTMLYLLTPMPPVPWFDTLYLVDQLKDKTASETLAYMAAYHDYARPVRALEWWAAAHVLGESARAYHVVNTASVAAGLMAIVAIARTLFAGWSRPLLVGALVGSSYAMVYPLLHFPFACNWALGLVGVAVMIRGA